MIAGPNGSGKSSLKEDIGERRLGVYLNPDEIEQRLLAEPGLDLSSLGIHLIESDLRKSLKSLAITKARNLDVDGEFRWRDGFLSLVNPSNRTYHASAIAELARLELLRSRTGFTFETVMSDPSKVEFLCNAQSQGFRTYLYFIATDSPEINVHRVAARVRLGGHDVPEEKIRKRYLRSLELLPRAIQCANRAYLFDNSGEGAEKQWLAEFNDDGYDYKTRNMPAWFMTYVDAKLGPTEPEST